MTVETIAGTSDVAPPVDVDRLVDAGAVADYLGVPKSWVRAKSQQGELPCHHLGRYRRFRLREVADWLEGRAER